MYEAPEGYNQLKAIGGMFGFDGKDFSVHSCYGLGKSDCGMTYGNAKSKIIKAQGRSFKNVETNMNRKIVLLLCLSSLSVFSGCGTVFEDGYVDPGPPLSGAAWYQKPGATPKEISEAYDKCDERYPDDMKLDQNVRLNIYFKQRFCMEDQGYFPKSGTRAIKSCKNFRNPKVPICEARGAYN